MEYSSIYYDELWTCKSSIFNCKRGKGVTVTLNSLLNSKLNKQYTKSVLPFEHWFQLINKNHSSLNEQIHRLLWIYDTLWVSLFFIYSIHTTFTLSPTCRAVHPHSNTSPTSHWRVRQALTSEMKRTHLSVVLIRDFIIPKGDCLNKVGKVEH